MASLGLSEVRNFSPRRLLHPFPLLPGRVTNYAESDTSPRRRDEGPKDFRPPLEESDVSTSR